MTTHILPMLPASDYDQRSYGILLRSALVYQVRNAPGERRPAHRVHNPGYPHRIVVWDNTIRPNTDPDSYSEHTGHKIGRGRFVDPHRRGTDEEISVLLSSEEISISPNRSRPATGDVRSGQQYAQEDILTIGDTVQLQMADSLSEEYQIQTRPLANPVLVPVRLLAAD